MSISGANRLLLISSDYLHSGQYRPIPVQSHLSAARPATGRDGSRVRGRGGSRVREGRVQGEGGAGPACGTNRLEGPRQLGTFEHKQMKNCCACGVEPF